MVPKVESPVRGEFSYERRVGEAKGTGLEPGEATPGFRFEGLGGRRVERAVKPQYPEEAEERGLIGHGRLKFTVLPTGQVLEVTVLRSSGWSQFDRAAVQALRKFLFTPLDDGEVAEHEVEFEFSF
jgi:TonB family protein